MLQHADFLRFMSPCCHSSRANITCGAKLPRLIEGFGGFLVEDRWPAAACHALAMKHGIHRELTVL